LVASFRSTVTHFCESIALIGPSQQSVDGILTAVEDRFTPGSDVVPTICGAVP
jgi:hypothetical protein